VVAWRARSVRRFWWPARHGAVGAANETRGGSIEDPQPLFTISEPGVGQAGTSGRWHSAAFTCDGKVIAAGWEPGGGTAPECETTDPDGDTSPSAATTRPAHG